MKEFLTRRWKTLTLAVFAIAFFAVSKFKPEWQLEKQLIETLQHIVEQTPE